MITTLGNYGFNFIREITDSPIGAFSVGVEKRSDPSYNFDNRTREPLYLFQYTLDGSGTLETGGKTYEIAAGQGFFLRFPDTDRYYFDPQRNRAPWHFIYVLFEGRGVNEYFELVTSRCGRILTLDKDKPSILALETLFQAAQNRRITDSFTGERLVFDFLCKLCSDSLTLPKTLSDTVREAMRVMDTDFATLQGIADVAKRLQLTQNHLCRVFAIETDTTPLAYLTKARLQHAVNLLYRTDYSIERISRESGFSCGNYFCKVFRRHMGISPFKYRARAAGIPYDEIRI